MNGFNGLGMHMGTLSRLSHAKSRSISPEHRTGEKGKGGMAIDGPCADQAADLGQGWKVCPKVIIKAGETCCLADIQDSGAIQHIWMTPTGHWRHSIIRIYWDDQETPSVECPVGDFFASAWNGYAQINSLAICVNPGSALNCYWEMPFRKRCRITMTNIAEEDMQLFYQIDYTLTDVPDDAAYFHAQFRRVNPIPYKDVYTIVDGIQGQGHYVGTYMAWNIKSNGWWGEGEIKFYIDGDDEFPTICGTGTEDYFCASYNFENPDTHKYQEFTSPYAGMPRVIYPNGLYRTQMGFSLYRWHVMDPVRFENNLKVTIQALGWRLKGKFFPLQDDISSVAYWYQTLPTNPFLELGDRDHLELIIPAQEHV